MQELKSPLNNTYVMGGLVLAYNDYTEITGILIFSYRKADFKLWKEEYLRNLKSDHVYSRP